MSDQNANPTRTFQTVKINHNTSRSALLHGIYSSPGLLYHTTCSRFFFKSANAVTTPLTLSSYAAQSAQQLISDQCFITVSDRTSRSADRYDCGRNCGQSPSSWALPELQGTSITIATPAAATSTWRGRGNTQHPQRSPAPRRCCGRGSGYRD
ncbi:hypothetical protein Y032_0008g367 [Ancylostoma ceylanicum]|uniref:Uncharacterized protein n=1 Tax=Ancylostoma ceylanicum TaxID=53326 RepID=A0A016VN34_9BILA|nr:hypothetical protein Y032_0008g367 [Ancylostoma ceylanicum]